MFKHKCDNERRLYAFNATNGLCNNKNWIMLRVHQCIHNGERDSLRIRHNLSQVDPPPCEEGEQRIMYK